jgi:exonuclease SbcC
MRLISLKLLNFRQHADTSIEFRSGLTGIIGPNGAGKTTILEAIAWAVYGSAAARGTNETIRFARAPGRSRVQVELVFELSGHEHRVVRSLNSAEVYLDGSLSPVATGLGTSTEYLQTRLGMTHEEFFNTYFTGQKELQFLAQMGPTQRARFLGQVLGYERLRIAQDRARARRNELRHEIEGLRAALPDPADLAAQTRAAETRRKDARARLENAESDRRKAEAKLVKLQPRWETACAARDAAHQLEHEIKLVEVEQAQARMDLQRLDAELAAIAKAAAELEPLREPLAGVAALDEQCRQFARLAALAEKKRMLEQSAAPLAREISDADARIQALEEAPRLADQFRQEIETLRVQLATAEETAERLHGEWRERHQEVETKLATYRDHAQELKDQLQSLREAGPDGICPTCERPLGAGFDKVVQALQDEWDKLVQDGKWLRQRGEQLADRPPEVAAAEQARDALRAAHLDRSQKLSRCEAAAGELAAVRVEQTARRKRMKQLTAQIAEIPVVYDAAAHRTADARLAELRTLERRAARLEQVLETRPSHDRNRARATQRDADVVARLAALKTRRKELRFSESDFDKLKKQFDVLREHARRLELAAVEQRGVFSAAEQALDAALRAQDEYRERSTRLVELELDQRHHTELDSAFTRLRAELNARVRPELGELASAFLTEITDGRYTSIEIDDTYDVLVLDEGEEKPVISGGEEDVANLVLRLAVSQMIADRAGQPLSILILDEVFGSLDVERRDNVIQLLHRLQDRFDQVILITHIDTIREGLDNIIRVDYDERTGSSRVQFESLAAGAAYAPLTGVHPPASLTASGE